MGKDNNIIRKVLVVDDNEVNTLVLAKMLELFGIDTDKAYSGKDAVKMSKKREYELVFIDHFMPDMDGVQTTKQLRTIFKDPDRTAIFALTSDVTNDIISMYREAGANDVYEKPLGVSELFAILKQLPSAINDVITIAEPVVSAPHHKELVRNIVEEIGGIDYEIGMKYAVGASLHYIYLLKVALKDIQTSTRRMKKDSSIGDLEALQIEIHNLKSVFSNIGAMELLNETMQMEGSLKHSETDVMKRHLLDYISHIKIFNKNLHHGLEKYNKNKPSPIDKIHKESCSMTKAEYEQSLTKTIYYIKIFDYVSIVKELEKLMQSGNPQFNQDFAEALEDIREFDYDKALERIKRIMEEGDKT